MSIYALGLLQICVTVAKTSKRRKHLPIPLPLADYGASLSSLAVRESRREGVGCGEGVSQAWEGLCLLPRKIFII